MSDINKSIRELVNYGLHTGLVVPEDAVYSIRSRKMPVRYRIWKALLAVLWTGHMKMVFWRKIPWHTVICLTQS